MTLPAGYFDEMYAASPDPWGFRDRWYEERKRDITLASLPQRRYPRAFEAGCSVGLVTALLAGRCDRLLAVDASAAAVAETQREVAAYPWVQVACRVLPDGWPEGEVFDLVVLSEMAYYLDDRDLAVLLDRAVASLAPGAALLACHWRHPVADYPLSGDAVHEAIAARADLVQAVRHEEADFLLEVFTRGPAPSPAELDGLVA